MSSWLYDQDEMLPCSILEMKKARQGLLVQIVEGNLCTCLFTIVFIFLYHHKKRKKQLKHKSSVLQVKMESRPSSRSAAVSEL